MTAQPPPQGPAPDDDAAPVSYEHLSERVTVVRIGADPTDDGFDVYTARPVRAVVADLLGQGRNLLVFDLTGLAIVDSTGLVTLVRVSRLLRAHGGELVVVVTDKRTLSIFRIDGRTRGLTLCAGVERAVELLERRGAERSARIVTPPAG
ncbi:STAS domain-containing protein [Streptomyces sp. NPDC048057]|uniref:STAS domain-containing protein n=1 Tax=Streptomyces sp. NPDC048057 TaxID=3155628 RepID=UPI0033E0A453